MHDDATVGPTCRQCHAPIDVTTMGFVDLTRPRCGACSGAPATVPADVRELVDLTPADTEPSLRWARVERRAQRVPAIRDLVRASVSPTASDDTWVEPDVPAADPSVSVADDIVVIEEGGGVGHDLRPGAAIDLRDGVPGARPPEPTLWTEHTERAGLRELLNRTRPLGIEVLHDRQPEGSLHPIDHLVVAPSGVWVIDSMGDTGRVQGCEASDFLRPAWRLYVGGVDRTVLLDDVRRRAGAVRNLLVASGEGRVPVRPILCFSDSALGPVTPPFVLTGVLVTSRRHVVEPFSLAPGLDRASRRWVRDLLADLLPGAS